MRFAIVLSGVIARSRIRGAARVSIYSMGGVFSSGLRVVGRARVRCVGIRLIMGNKEIRGGIMGIGHRWICR